MARIKMTEEQKKQRDAERKAAKIAAREAEWAARKAGWAAEAEASRVKILEGLDVGFKSKFEKALKFAEASDNVFMKDIAYKWQKYGNLSQKQLEVLVNAVEREQKKEVISEVIEDMFTIGEKTEVPDITVRKMVEEEVFDDWCRSAGMITKISMAHQSGVNFMVKTSSAKLIDTFEAVINEGRKIKINATVKWHFKDSDLVILSARGLKVL